MRRKLATTALSALAVVATAAPALACGGLVNPNGTVSLVKTTTLAAYHDGLEHYVTSFEFAGGGAEFGSIVPLPAVPTSVKRAGDWTLQRLVQEITPPVAATRFNADGEVAALAGATVLMEKEIDSLKITILKGGAAGVGRWAEENGYGLSPDAPEVLEFYARRSPIFMAARFDPNDALASGKQVGDGVPIHLTIPVDEPWVPLRILGLGAGGDARIEADLFLLTDDAPPALLPQVKRAGARRGIVLERSEEASTSLLRDLRSDKGMDWLPASDMWLTYLRIDERAGDLVHDLAINTSGGAPSPVDAGLVEPRVADLLPAPDGKEWSSLLAWGLAAALAAAVVLLTNRLARSPW